MKMPSKIKNLLKLKEIVTVPEFQYAYEDLSELKESYLSFKGTTEDFFSLRSAELDEDNDSSSNAGKHVSYINKSIDEVHNLLDGFGYGAIVQKMYPADYSGVAVYNKKTGILDLSLTQGLCSTITSGISSGDFFSIVDGEVMFSMPDMSQDRIIHLAKTSENSIEETKYSKLEMIYEYDLNGIYSIIKRIANHFTDFGIVNVEFSINNNCFAGLQCRNLSFK